MTRSLVPAAEPGRCEPIALPKGFKLRSFFPGRLRVQVPRRAVPETMSSLQELIDSGEATSVKLNSRTRSLLVRYDADAMPTSRFLRRAGLAPPEETIRWTIKSDTPGRLRACHPYLERYVGVLQRVSSGLLQLEGVTKYTVTAATSNVLVRYDPSVLPRAELLATLDELVEATGDLDESGLQPAPFENDAATVNLSLSSGALALSGAALAVPALAPLALLGTVVAGGHIFWAAAEALYVQRKIKVDILDAVVVGLALAYRYTWAGALMVWIVDIGDVLLDSSEKASAQMLSQVFGRQARKTRKLVDGEEVEVLVADLEIDDVVVIQSGEQIPVDGEVVGGEAMVDQHALTGEFAPVERSVGEHVFAMTSTLAGRIQVRVSRTGADTQASQIVQIIEQSVQHKVELQALSETFADRMVMPTLGLGAIGRVAQGPSAMLAVINADFGTGIRIAGPLAMLTALSTAARHGIIIKNGTVLESIHLLDAVIFDKTGTLTEETPMVGRVLTCDPGVSEEQLLTYMACAEQRFTHPIARAILRRAEALGLELPEIADSDYHVGFGIDVRIAGDHLKVGSQRFMEREDIEIESHLARHLESIGDRGGSAIFAALNGRLIGIVELEASPRPEGYRIIQHLRKRGLKEIYLISGDQEGPTRALAERLGIDHYFAEVLPEDKAEYVRMLQEQGLKVGMVGDGINDSVALSQADYSISLRGAADVATDVADVVFMDGDLARFDMLLDISEKLRGNVKQSFVLTLVPNTICIAGALVGVVGFGASLFFNNVFNMVATLNGMRPVYGSPQEEKRREAEIASHFELEA